MAFIWGGGGGSRTHLGRSFQEISQFSRSLSVKLASFLEHMMLVLKCYCSCRNVVLMGEMLGGIEGHILKKCHMSPSLSSERSLKSL